MNRLLLMHQVSHGIDIGLGYPQEGPEQRVQLGVVVANVGEVTGQRLRL